MCELASVARVAAPDLLIRDNIPAQYGLGHVRVSDELHVTVPQPVPRVVTLSAAVNAFLGGGGFDAGEYVLQFTFVVVNDITGDTNLTPSAVGATSVRAGGAPVNLTTTCVLPPGAYTAYVTASSTRFGLSAALTSEVAALTMAVQPCPGPCGPCHVPQPALAAVHGAAFSNVLLALAEVNTPLDVAESALAFSLPEASTVRLTAPLTAAGFLSPYSDVTLSFTVTRRAPPPTDTAVVEGASTLTLTLLNSIAATTELKSATLAHVAALPAGDYVVNVRASATVPMILRLSGRTAVAVFRCGVATFDTRTIARPVTIAVEPAAPTSIAVPVAFELANESCVVVSAPLTLVVANMNLLNSRKGVHVRVHVTTAAPATTVYLSVVPVVASLNTDLLGGTRDIAVTPVAFLTLPPGAYVAHVLAVVDSGIVPDVDAVVTGDVNVLAVQTRIA